MSKLFSHVSVAALSAAGVLAWTGIESASATIVATITGAYDDQVYDTPELIFSNTSGGIFTNAQMVLRAYQPGTLNYGDTATVALPNLALGGPTYLDWGYIPGAPSGTVPNNLTAYDYDDEWGEYPPGYTNPECDPEGQALCAKVGNFSVTYTATISGGMYNGDPVFAVFSPTNNYTGGFVGWEGLTPDGVSESVYDAHSGVISGTMAIIQIGTAPIPEPSTWAMMLMGFAGLGFAGHRARKNARAAKLA